MNIASYPRVLKPLSILFLSLLGVSLAMAQAVNLEPGEWEYTNELTIGESFSPETQVFTDCVTEDEIREGVLLGLTLEGCDVHDQTISRDGMRYVMTCEGPEGTKLSIDADIDFFGDRATGVINNTVATPLGDMAMVVNLTARRLGECSEADEEDKEDS